MLKAPSAFYVGLLCVFIQSVVFLSLWPELDPICMQWPLVSPGKSLLLATVSENSVLAAGTEPRAVLWRIFAQCQSDCKQRYGYVFPGEGVFVGSFTFSLSNLH